MPKKFSQLKKRMMPSRLPRVVVVARASSRGGGGVVYGAFFEKITWFSIIHGTRDANDGV